MPIILVFHDFVVFYFLVFLVNVYHFVNCVAILTKKTSSYSITILKQNFNNNCIILFDVWQFYL